MANIVISRIQHRRGRRENLPQPLLPAEIALTSDTSQAWIGQDPALAAASVNVYSDKLESDAQSIIDNQLVESRFDADFSAGTFDTMVTELKGNATVTLVDEDILWDSTFRGVILNITVSVAGTGFNIGDSVTAISSTGSGFVGEVDGLVGGAGTGLVSIDVQSGGMNYQYTNTTFTIAGGGSGETTTLLIDDVLATVVHIAADINVDADNTVANIITEVAALASVVTDRLISSASYVGTFISNSMVVNNHLEASNVAFLISRVNSTSPNQITGLAYTNLNIELTAGPDDITSFQLAASDLVTVITTGTTKAYFRMPRGMTVTEVRGSLLTASTAGTVDVDINKNGTTILSTVLTIDQDEKTSLTAAVPAVISDDTLANDDEITVDIDVAGTGALGLIVTLIGLA